MERSRIILGVLGLAFTARVFGASVYTDEPQREACRLWRDTEQAVRQGKVEPKEARRKFKFFGIGAGLISFAAIVFIMLKSLKSAAPDANNPAGDGDTASLGKLLFTQYTLPFEVVSVLLLVAMVGVILLCKKKLE